MTFVEAVINIIKEARSDRRPTQTSIERVVKSLRALGLNDPGLGCVLRYLDLVDRNGDPFLKTVKRTWK